MAPLFSYVSTQLFTGKGVQISCLGKTKKAGYFFVPLISPKLFQLDQVYSLLLFRNEWKRFNKLSQISRETIAWSNLTNMAGTKSTYKFVKYGKLKKKLVSSKLCCISLEKSPSKIEFNAIFQEAFRLKAK